MGDNLTKPIVKVSFDVEIPAEGCSPESIVEWLRFNYGDNGNISKDNPLYSYESEPVLNSFTVRGSNGTSLI